MKRKHTLVTLILIVLLSTGFVQSMFGQHSVNDDGSFNYSIPIPLPGPEGALKPAFALTYNSNVPNGDIGKGWMLTGVTSITIDSASLYERVTPIRWMVSEWPATVLMMNTIPKWNTLNG